MLDYNILKAKPNIQKKSNYDGTEYVLYKDLLSDVIDKNAKIYDCRLIEVSKDYIARPDLVSFAMYGTDKYGDIICKFNNLSNPFELNEGMILIIPDIMTIQKMIVQGKPSSIISANSKIGNIIKTNKKTKTEQRNPGEQTTSDSNFRIDKKNRLVIY